MCMLGMYSNCCGVNGGGIICVFNYCDKCFSMPISICSLQNYIFLLVHKIEPGSIKLFSVGEE